MRTKSTLQRAVKFVNNCKFIFSFKKNIFQKNIFPLLLLFTSTASFAQTENVDSYLTSLSNSGKQSEKAHLNYLLFDLQSAVYYLSNNSSVKTYGENPTAFYTDVNSVSHIPSVSIPDQDIEIATIKILSSSELGKSIDLGAFSNFRKLKYIYIASQVQTNEAVLNSMIRNNTSKYVIIYKISIGG